MMVRFCPFPARWHVSQDYILVLVFAATIAWRWGPSSSFRGKMAKLSMYMSNSQKVRMNYSCHGRYKGIHIVLNLFSLLSS